MVDYVPKPIKNAASKAFLRAKNSILGLYDGAKKTLKGDVEGEAEKENQEDGVDLTPGKHERALNRSYRSFVISDAPKTDIDIYFDQTKLNIKTLIKSKLKEMGSAKVIMTLWVRWKKPVMPLIELDPDNGQDGLDIDNNTGDNYTSVQIPFNSLMTEFFESSDINRLTQYMLTHIKTQVGNPRMPESGFALDEIMQLYIDFHRLELTGGSSYTELPEWIKIKKAVINQGITKQG